MNRERPQKERRLQPRTSGDNALTSIVQLLIQHPGRVADVRAQDLAAGADADALSGLLDAAEAVLALRGVDRCKQLAALRKRLERPKR